jgi:hypothetical protein
MKLTIKFFTALAAASLFASAAAGCAELGSASEPSAVAKAAVWEAPSLPDNGCIRSITFEDNSSACKEMSV